MTVNPWLFPVLALAAAAFLFGGWAGARVAAPGGRAAWLAAAGLAALPGLLFTLYYTHLFDNAGWFYAFRTLPGTELSAAGLGVLAGMLPAFIRGRRLFGLAARTAAAGLLFLWLLVPYAKSLLWPAPPSAFRDQWDGAVCLQSTPSSCGPAAGATLLRAAGLPAREADLARESYTSLSGTEVWYLARALQRRGLRVRYTVTPPDPARLPSPALAGTRLNTPTGPGHFIALLAPGHAGDPLVGPVTLTAADHRPYHFTGFFLRVERDE